MLIRLFSTEKGIHSMRLPDTCDGVTEVCFVDREGKQTRLADAVGDREKWTIHAKPGCGLKILETSGGAFNFTPPRSMLEVNGDVSVLINSGSTEYYMMCVEESRYPAPSIYTLPLEREVSCGYLDDNDISLSYPVIKDKHLSLTRGADGMRLCVSRGAETFLNGQMLTEEVSYPSVGSIIDIYGLRIVYLGQHIAIYAYAGSGVKCHLSLYKSILRDVPGIIVENDEVYVFNRSPRIYQKRETPKFNIDSPPAPEKQEETPLLLQMGSQAMMGMASIMMATMTMQTAIQTGASLTSVLPSVFMSSGMFVGSLIMPIINRKYNARHRAEKEAIRRKKYLEYLNGVAKSIYDVGQYQKQLLEEAYPTQDELFRYAIERDDHLWERMVSHSDFLDVRLGRSTIPIDMDINDPGEHFSLEDDKIRNAFDSFRTAPRVIDDAPYMLPLRKNKVLGIFGEYEKRIGYVRNLIAQLCIQHSYKELKLVFLIPPAALSDWEFALWLPHSFSDDFAVRFIASTTDELRDLSKTLKNLCFVKTTGRAEDESMHTVIVIADNRLTEMCGSLQDAMKIIEAYPASVIALAEKPGDLPKECRTVIALNESNAALFPNIDRMEKAIGVKYDQTADDSLTPISLALRHTRLAETEKEGSLPDSVSYFDMMRVGNVSALNAPARWKASNPVKTLAAPLGVDKDGALFNLDIHQKSMGPHGLVAGTTGSGKSEFLISYLLSMAVYYDPLEVGFVLIDYKGGGMSDTLKSLPHVVGVIDNLGGKEGIHRSMVCITNELKRRQRIFKEAGELLNMKNIDIHEYQKLYRKGKVKEPLSHLIIVSDEFAELKQQEPQFMDDLVSAARIGRSLGVHLILATQKPTGVVNDQILSNTRFKVCMKVQDRGDSMSMLGKPDAAKITKAGRFYLQVGMDEIFMLGQGAYAGADATNDEYYSPEPDRTVKLNSLSGQAAYSCTPEAYKKKKDANSIKQVDAICAYLADTAKTLQKIPRQIWLPLLKDTLCLADLEEKYHPTFTPFAPEGFIGEVDDPVSQSQFPLCLNLANGNILALGNAGSGLEELCESFIVSLCTHHSPKETNIYSLDFASEVTRAFSQMPHIAEVMARGDDEKISNFFMFLDTEMARRRSLLASYGGSIDMYREKYPDSCPNIVVIIQNYAAFIEAYEEYDDRIYSLVRDASSFGIYFLVTAANTRAVRSRLSQSFKQYYCFQMTEEMEYVNLLGKTEGVYPMKRLGSGISVQNGRVTEFQLAWAIKERDNPHELRRLSEEIKKKYGGIKAKGIRVLPEAVGISDLTSNPESILLSQVPVGMHYKRLESVYMDLSSNHISLILYRDLPEFKFITSLARTLSAGQDRKVWIIDATGQITDVPGVYNLVNTDSAICEAVDSLLNEALARRQEQKKDQAEGRTSVFTDIEIFICSIRRVYDKLRENESKYPKLQEKLDALLERGIRSLGIGITIYGRADEMSAFSLRPWYSYIDRSNGLFIGNGIGNQQLLRQNNVSRESQFEGPFGYYVKNENAQIVKLLERA